MPWQAPAKPARWSDETPSTGGCPRKLRGSHHRFLYRRSLPRNYSLSPWRHLLALPRPPQTALGTRRPPPPSHPRTSGTGGIGPAPRGTSGPDGRGRVGGCVGWREANETLADTTAPGTRLNGALVHIPRNALSVATQYTRDPDPNDMDAPKPDPEARARAKEVLRRLGPEKDRLEALAHPAGSTK